jgi:mycofactocin precursor
MSVPAGGEPVPPDTPDSQTSESANEALVVEELLVEDVSIDGMCGVY